MALETVAIVTARNEAQRIGATLTALRQAFPGVQLLVADDASVDATADLARAAGARVLTAPRRLGKGGAATLAAREALRVAADGAAIDEAVVLLCDGDLGSSAARLGPLVDSVRSGESDLAVATFTVRLGGGFGLAVRFARWAIARSCALRLTAPISGQRALRAQLLGELLPFAHGFGMELAMTIDAARLGQRVVELELDLEHRVSGRSLRGFAHRARQLGDFVRAYSVRR